MKRIKLILNFQKKFLIISLFLLFLIVSNNSCSNVAKDKNITNDKNLKILVNKQMINPETNKLLFDYYVDYNDTTVVEGVARLFDQKGILKSQTIFENGKMVGVAIIFDENGNVNGLSKFNNGELSETTVYYPNGQLKFKKNYKDSCIYNILIYKDTLGKDVYFGDFKNGNGNLYIFDSLNVVTQVCFLKNGRKLYEVTGKDTFRYAEPVMMK